MIPWTQRLDGKGPLIWKSLDVRQYYDGLDTTGKSTSIFCS